MKKKIYIAGKLNDMACDYIKNVHQMIVWADKVRKAGFAVYIPAIDFLVGVIIGDWDYYDYFNNSQLFLVCCDAVFLVPGWQNSKGTIKEIGKAQQHNIPIFTYIQEMVDYFKGG